MKKSTLLKLIWLWPPFLGAGIRVKKFSPDLLSLEVEMKLKFWNKNYFGTQFGGSLFSMTDPFYALMLLEHLGKDYIIWDKSSSIRFKAPGRGKVFAKFALDKETIEEIRLNVHHLGKAEPKFTIHICDQEEVVVAEVVKTLYVKHKTMPSTKIHSQGEPV